MDTLFSSLKAYCQHFVQLSEEEFAALSSSCETIPVKKKELILDDRHVADKIFFFDKGFFRYYHFKDDGTEITSDFIFPPGFLTSFTSLITREPSRVCIQAMADTEVLRISYDGLMALYERYHALERLGRLLTEQTFVFSEKHLLSFLNDPPLERYRWLLKEHPEFVKHIPLHMLASYLGITPETLSRIRKRIIS